MNYKKGYVLISVLVIMMVMLVITYFLADALFTEYSIARNQKAGTIAFNLAEAGVSEAIWRIQNEPGAKDKFLNSTDGQTDFAHNPALITNGEYSVNITNTAKGVATITATGLYHFGLKTAQRKITQNVTQAITPPPYDYDGAIFTGGSTGEQDITVTAVNLNVTNGGSLISNRDIWYTFSNINIAKDILAKGNIRNWFSNVTAGGVIRENDPGTYNMPSIDINSSDPNSFLNRAIAQGQYFTGKEFDDLLHAQNNLIFNGIVFVDGGINIAAAKRNEPAPTVTINGVLVANGSIDVGAPGKKGTLTVNHIVGQPSGLITTSKFTAWAYSVINITGLVYIGDRFSFDLWFNLDPATEAINITGGILSRRFNGNGLRTINIVFNKDLINEGLLPNPPETPVIQFQHWEEEY